MSTCREIVRDAFLEIGGLADGAEPSAEDGRVGLRRLQALLDDLSGQGIGARLRDVTCFDAPELEPNVCAVVTMGAPVLTLPGAPDDGARVQVIDTRASGPPLTIGRNGRTIHGVASDLLVMDSPALTLLYRADRADWRLVGALGLDDDFPYAPDTEDAFTVLLAFRLAPGAGLTASAELGAAVQAALGKLRARLRQRRPVRLDRSILPTRQAFGRWGWGC